VVLTSMLDLLGKQAFSQSKRGKSKVHVPRRRVNVLHKQACGP
jgi:hypothetical protein